MNRLLNAVLATGVVGICFTPVCVGQDELLVPPAPAPETTVLAPPVSVGPYYAYNEPVHVAPMIVSPVYVAPVYVQPVVPAPIVVVADWYAPAYVAPMRVTVHSSPWWHRTEYEYLTPDGAREVEYRVDRHGRVRIDYDD